MQFQVDELRAGSIRALLITAGAFFTATFWTIVVTYPSFFLFNPFENDNPLRATLLTALIAAWVLLANGPIVLLGYFAVGHGWPLRLLPIVALAWPVLLLANHVSLAIVEGNWYLDYIIDYPIFFVTDIFLPLFLMAIWFELRPSNHPVAHAVGRHRA